MRRKYSDAFFMRVQLFLLVMISMYACKGRVYTEPASSMEETIMKGEPFYVSQAKNFKRDDIIVFEYWGDDYTRPLPDQPGFEKNWQKWVKRMIALSGDTFQVKDAEVYINGKASPSPPGSLMEYDLLATTFIDDLPQRNEFDQTLVSTADSFHYVVLLTAAQAAEYRNRKPAIASVKKRIAIYESGDTSLAKSCTDCKWTVDNYGPLKIPSPGDTINVNTANFRMYQQIPGITYGKNILKEKLYFVMGDNRHRSQDSRYIGFVPHSNMYGIVK